VIPRFSVYLFDIDGTLLDSALDICGAVQKVLDGHPCRAVDFEFLKSYIGRSLETLFRGLYPEYNAEQIEGLFQEYRTNYRSRCHANTRVFPGVAEALPLLGGRKSTATTKGTPTTRLVLEQFGLLPYFDHVQGTDGFPSKPEPDVIFTSLAALGASPEDCLFVGDSEVDMQAGRRAGVKTCAVRYGYGSTEELARHTPDYWVNDLRELVG
jgi:phosphoglycolate phosphatase